MTVTNKDDQHEERRRKDPVPAASMKLSLFFHNYRSISMTKSGERPSWILHKWRASTSPIEWNDILPPAPTGQIAAVIDADALCA